MKTFLASLVIKFAVKAALRLLKRPGDVIAKFHHHMTIAGGGKVDPTAEMPCGDV